VEKKLCVCLSSQQWLEAKNRRLTIQNGVGKKAKPCLQNNQSKKELEVQLKW
jgi:hypothetical protein